MALKAEVNSEHQRFAAAAQTKMSNSNAGNSALAAEAPESWKAQSPKKRGRRESRVRGGTHSPACKNKKAHERRRHRFTGTVRPSLRNGFNGFLRALPGDRAFLPPSSLRSVSFLRT
jgi:hypothetical protein